MIKLTQDTLIPGDRVTYNGVVWRITSIEHSSTGTTVTGHDGKASVPLDLSDSDSLEPCILIKRNQDNEVYVQHARPGDRVTFDIQGSKTRVIVDKILIGRLFVMITTTDAEEIRVPVGCPAEIHTLN